MGLPPAQGHNNLRLTNTAKMYQYQNTLRLDRTQFTPIKTHYQKSYPSTKFKINKIDSHPFLPLSSSSSLLLRKPYAPMPMPSHPQPVSILKPSRSQSFCHKNFVQQHVQFAPIRNRISERKVLDSYPHRSLSYMHSPHYTSVNAFATAAAAAASSSIEFNNRPHIFGKKVRMKVQPKLNLLSHTKERRQQNARTTYPSRRHTIVSNMPLINVNSSVVMVNHSPFGLQDPRFGIFHHCSQSISYF